MYMLCCAVLCCALFVVFVYNIISGCCLCCLSYCDCVGKSSFGDDFFVTSSCVFFFALTYNSLLSRPFFLKFLLFSFLYLYYHKNMRSSPSRTRATPPRTMWCAKWWNGSSVVGSARPTRITSMAVRWCRRYMLLLCCCLCVWRGGGGGVYGWLFVGV